MISMIVAVSEDLGIGKNNELLWHIPGDLSRFKKLTMGKTVIMGRKTWESLPGKPLPGRRNIVITDIAGEKFEGAVSAYSVSEALDLCSTDEEAFIMGGGSIYRQFMPYADRLYITRVHKNADADVYFPAIDPETWKVTGKEEYNTPGSDALPYTYLIYERREAR